MNMIDLDLRESRFVTIRKNADVIYHAKRLTTGQYFTYRRIYRAIEQLPPVNNAESLNMLKHSRKELARLIFANHEEPQARRELWDMSLSELLERCEYLLAGERSSKYSSALAEIVVEDAVIAIMRTFPAYKLHHLALMPAFEFLTLVQLAKINSK